eukprot:TRINITY_DN12917_c0_g1_i1.p1 TRINITY_DN12917_c0_g1~~TRINITY_DN12917_c0_g1_i1.p1  ORF type:complete len:243 (-),score=54.20 TRINITY_DN12917_c0_g1_i1:390-1118(-)
MSQVLPAAAPGTQLSAGRGRWQRRLLANDQSAVAAAGEVELLSGATSQEQDEGTEEVGRSSGSRARWRRELRGSSDGGDDGAAGNCASSNGSLFRREDVAADAAIAGLCPRSKLSLLSSARLLQTPDLAGDLVCVLRGGAHHLKGVFCEANDLELFGRLKAEIEDSGFWRSRGLDRFERTIAPEGGQRSTGRIHGEDALVLAKLPAHRYVLEHLAGLFDATPLSWWINLYPTGRDAKNFHKD